MNDGRPVVGIDVGSSTVSVIVAAMDGDQLVVYGCGQARHDGARKGVIGKLEEVSAAVLAAAEEAEAMASVPVEQAVVGIGGTPITGNPSTASVSVTGRNHTVSREDVSRALAACANWAIPPDYQVLDILPCGFALDGHAGMEYPVGMPGRRLDAAAYVLCTNKTHAETVAQTVNRASVAVDRLVHEPMAAAAAVLSRDERELGCLLLDIGYATTEWLLIAEGVVNQVGTIPVGGRHFTADLATMLKTTTAAAEQTKRLVGGSPHRESLDNQAVEVPSLGGEGNHVHKASFAAEVLHERARDLFIGIHRVLVEQDLDRLPRSGVVLTGGGALLEGLEEIAEVIFGHRVRVGSPRGLAGLVEPVSTPEWAVSCGLVRIVCSEDDRILAQQHGGGGLFKWIRSTLEDFFEMGGGQ